MKPKRWLRLNHPNIAQIYGVEERALVIELVEGEWPKGPQSFGLADPRLTAGAAEDQRRDKEKGFLEFG